MAYESGDKVWIKKPKYDDCICRWTQSMDKFDRTIQTLKIKGGKYWEIENDPQKWHFIEEWLENIEEDRFKSGNTIKILRRPESWSSYYGGKYPLNLTYPRIEIIAHVSPEKDSFISTLGYGYSIRSLRDKSKLIGRKNDIIIEVDDPIASMNIPIECYNKPNNCGTIATLQKTMSECYKSLKETVKMSLKTEPIKTMIKAGILDRNEDLTEEGLEILQDILVTKYAEELKEAADIIIADRDKK